MSGIGALSIAIQGLNAAQQQLQVISSNVANASTPGYTVKTLQQNSVVLDGSGSGVQVGGLQRSVNTALQSNLWQQTSTSGSSQVNQTYLQQLQQLFGAPNSNTSFASDLATVQSDFITLSADPSNSIYQTQVVNDAQSLTSNLNNLSTSIQGLRNNSQTDISNDLGQANQLLQTIASLNTNISKTGNAGGDVTDLEDQRDQAIQQLSQFININTYTNSDGSVTVQTQNGTLLADTQAQTLDFSVTPLTATSVYPTSASGITVNGQDITSQITSGSIGGLINLRDQSLPQAQAMIDEFSEGLATRFNAQGVTLFTDPAGDVPTDTPGDYVGFAGTIQVNPAVVNNPALLQQGTAGGPPLAAGDNTNIQNVLNYAFGDNSNAGGTPNTPFNTTGLGANGAISVNLPSGGDILDYSNNVVATLAQQYTQVNSNNTYQTNYQQTLQEQMDNESGVSIDTEMTNMISIQNAYSASARMITAVSQMFTDLLSAVSS